jgi:hypothetical protein
MNTRWDNKAKANVREIKHEGVDEINVAGDRYQ